MDQRAKIKIEYIEISLTLFAISGSARQSNNGRKESMRYEPT